MMTFYLALEALKAKANYPRYGDAGERGGRASLDERQRLAHVPTGRPTRRQSADLFYGLMASGNDAAVVLSEYLAGSQECVCRVDEQKGSATRSGPRRIFTNPDGLPTDDEYTTAADMVKLGRAVIRDLSRGATQYTGVEGVYLRQDSYSGISTRCSLYDSRVNGIKTGHVEEAGFPPGCFGCTYRPHVGSCLPSWVRRAWKSGASKPTSCSTGPFVPFPHRELPDWHKSMPIATADLQG